MGFGVMCQEIVNRKLCYVYAEEYMATTINIFTLKKLKELREKFLCVTVIPKIKSASNFTYKWVVYCLRKFKEIFQ